MTYVFRLFDFWNFFFLPSFFLLFFSFCCSDWPPTGLHCGLKTSKKAPSRQANFSMEQPGVVAGNFALSFSLTFWAFLYISKAPFSRSLWSGHHCKDLFLLQKLRINDANFGQKWWRQKWKKGQGSSWAVTGSTRVNGLKKSWYCNFFSKMCEIFHLSTELNLNFQRFTNGSQRLLKIWEDFRRSPKIFDDFWRFPEDLRR